MCAGLNSGGCCNEMRTRPCACALLQACIVATSATFACSLTETTVNNSRKGFGFAWHGALLKKTAPCPMPGTCTNSKCSAATGRIGLGMQGLCLWQQRHLQKALMALRAHAHEHSHGEHGCDGHTHGHKDGELEEHVAACCDHTHEQDTSPLTTASDRDPKATRNVLLVMDEAENGTHDSDGHGHSHQSAATGHTHSHAPAAEAAACSDADCEHEHGAAGHSHSHSHSHSHGAADAKAEECTECDGTHGEGHSHSHETSHSHSHSHGTASPLAAAAAGAAGATGAVQTEADVSMSSREIVGSMLKVFMEGQGTIAAAGCMLVLFLTKVVKVAVPFLYQYLLDTLTSGSTCAPGFLSQIIAGIANAQLLPTAATLLVLYTGTKILAQALQSSNDVVFSYAVQPAVRRAGRATVQHLLNMPLSFYTQANTGALTRSMERGIRAITSVLSRILLHLMPQSVELVLVAGIIGMRAGADLALVAVSTVVCYVWFTVVTVSARIRHLEAMNQADNQATSRLLDALINHEVVRSYNRQGWEADRYEDSVKRYQGAQIKSLVALAVLNFGQKTIEALGAGLLLWKTATMVMAGSMSVGELIMINSLLLQLMAPLDHLGANYMQLNQGLVDAKDMFSILRQKTDASGQLQKLAPPAADGAQPQQHPPPQPSLPQFVTSGQPVEIAFKDVHFAYSRVAASVAGSGAGGAGGEMVLLREGGGTGHSHGDVDREEAVLKGFDLTIRPGSMVAIVGESGCGKSTLTRLLTRTVTASKGEVLLNGQDVTGLDVASVRDAVALVSQDSTLFNEDVAYNIAYGNPDADAFAVGDAARNAQLDSVMEGMPQGLATIVGDRGSRLSGGQRQRVALARALVKQAPILLCDEATSALDVYTEGRVMEGLREVGVGKTIIIIAHRLSTIVNADEIVVMENGRVAERGTHDRLLAQRGSRYAAMWAAQEREVKERGDVVREVRQKEAQESIQEMLATGSDDACGCGHAH